ncbi:uroporphyrinogen-III synthase [Vibrio casei]|uniref:Uroporphyrinogen-III synthase n=1 Tax=Vibrio casei TaxID=673372 RepID=A0A368LKC0_9VIBR|nr:uroporphyrinogen-III synthase [Vibrio casei]RCS72235.1 uroporphyrinogen-III synthase [Vibrio casei]SJN39885.1 Uroporphyrinogen-III synthase [Vibrio casei]
MSVLVTRPGKDGEALCTMLQKHNIASLHHPLIQLEQGSGYTELPQDMETSDIIIAVSQHAVHWANHALQYYHADFPQQATYFAIGEKTAHSLTKLTQKEVIFPLISDSEHLLDLPALKSVKNKRILILRGNGGRELIYQTLSQRGARVHYNEIYQRNPISITDPTLWAHWQDAKVTQLVVTSGEQLEYLIQQIPKQYLRWLKQLTLYIPSQRIGQQAEKFGFLHIINTGSAANPILLDYLSGKLITGQEHDR